MRNSRVIDADAYQETVSADAGPGPVPAIEPALSTREAVLQAAEIRLAEVGWLSLSFRDLAERLDMRAPSIHYHFPSKTDLGIALINRLRTVRMLREQTLVAEHPTQRERLLALASLLLEHDADVSSNYTISPFQAEFSVLPVAMQRLVTAWIDDCLASIATWLEEGRLSGEFVFPGSSHLQALVVWSVLEQGYQLHRTHPDTDLLALVRQVVDTLSPSVALQEKFA